MNTGSEDPVFNLKTIEYMFEYAIRSGQIKLEGKSDDQIKDEFHVYLENIAEAASESRLEVTFTIDHTDDLLVEALSSSASGTYIVSIILYATWIEHWLNRLIRDIGFKNGLNRKERTQIIRRTQWDAKFVLLKLLGYPEIHKDIIGDINNIFDTRNRYVHYKWKEESLNEPFQPEVLIEKAEAVVDYLQRYENDHIFSGKLDHLSRIIGGNGEDL